MDSLWDMVKFAFRLAIGAVIFFVVSFSVLVTLSAIGVIAGEKMTGCNFMDDAPCVAQAKATAKKEQ
jgi:hypothetical protein